MKGTVVLTPRSPQAATTPGHVKAEVNVEINPHKRRKTAAASGQMGTVLPATDDVRVVPYVRRRVWDAASQKYVINRTTT